VTGRIFQALPTQTNRQTDTVALIYRILSLQGGVFKKNKIIMSLWFMDQKNTFDE
jgi:hypothetical protein